MKKLVFTLLFAGLLGGLLAQNSLPVIANLTANYNAANQRLTLQFDLSDLDGDPIEISVLYSENDGLTFLPATAFLPSGDVGSGIAGGLGKMIVCDMSSQSVGQKLQFRVVADDLQKIDIHSLVSAVDSNRLLNDLKFVQGIRHRTAGASHLQATRDTILKLFQNEGFSITQQEVPFGSIPGKNIIGTHRGAAQPQNVAIIDAHFDSVSNSPGADDNGSGTVGMMEAARVLSKYRFKKTLRFIGFDLEESGLVGSTRYVNSGLPQHEVVEGVFNFEMIGFYSDQPGTQELPAGFNLLFPQAYSEVAANDFRGNFITNVGNQNSQSLITHFQTAANQYVPQLKVISVAVPGTGTLAPDLRRSDHAPFWDAGKKALMITDGANFRNECYHTPQDTADDKLSFTFMSNVVKATVAAAALLAEPVHADWQDVPVEITLGTAQPDPCTWKITHRSAGSEIFWIDAEGCPAVSEATAEVVDEKGGVLFSKRIQIPGDGQRYFSTAQKLPSGIYFLRIQSDKRTQTERFFIN